MKDKPPPLFERETRICRGMKLRVFQFNKDTSIEYMVILRGVDKDYTQRGDSEEEAIQNLLDQIEIRLWERCCR